MIANEQQLATAIARLDGLVGDMTEVKRSMRELAAAVTKLAVVEERQHATSESLTRAFAELARNSGRIAALELAQPLQKQSSDWVRKAVGLIIAAVMGAVVTGALHNAKAADMVIVGHPL